MAVCRAALGPGQRRPASMAHHEVTSEHLGAYRADNPTLITALDGNHVAWTIAGSATHCSTLRGGDSAKDRSSYGSRSLPVRYPTRVRKIGLIGFGAIGRAIVGAWPGHLGDREHLCALLVRSKQISAASSRVSSDILVTADLASFLDRDPEIIIEAAGHDAVAQYATTILERACQLHLFSTGALADDTLRAQLLRAAKQGGGRIVIPTGALAGFDGLLSMRTAGLTSVKYTSTKPVAAWRRTAAEATCNLHELTRPQVFFSGSAREAAKAFPRNANLAAAVALAGIGFDRTEVALVADPGATENTGRIDAVSSVGRLHVMLSGAGFTENPKSSQITAMSAIATLLEKSQLISFC